MRDGSGNKPSREEEQKMKSIQGAPDNVSVSGITIKPNAGMDRGAADTTQATPDAKPAADVEERRSGAGPEMAYSPAQALIRPGQPPGSKAGVNIHPLQDDLLSLDASAGLREGALKSC